MVDYQPTSGMAWQDWEGTPWSDSLDARILTTIRAHNDTGGIICENVEDILGAKHQSCSANIRRLKERGIVFVTGEQEKTSSGRWADLLITTWKPGDPIPPLPLLPRPIKSNGQSPMNVNTHSSILGGSNAARLLACPASYLEQLRNPSQKDVTSSYAEEGTMLHSMIAGIVGGEGAVEDMITTEQAEVLMTAKQALDDLKGKFGGKFRIVGVESMLPFPGITPASFGSVDLVLANKTHVLVVDWKFGKGIPVKALYEDDVLGDLINPQLAFYAVAARARFKRSFKNKQVVVAIIQPRMPQPLDYVEVAEYELDDFQVAFQRAYLEAISGRNARREKGEHCRFASCKATCPLWVGPVIEMSVLDPKRAALEASTRPIEATSDYGAYLSRAMHLAELAETWAGEIRKQAHVYLEDGGLIPEWKLVPKRGMRKWADEAETPRALTVLGAGEVDIYTEPELRSVAQVEKALKGRGIALPEDMWMMVSSGTTIAPAGDPRPESTHGQVAENVRKALKAL